MQSVGFFLKKQFEKAKSDHSPTGKQMKDLSQSEKERR